MRGDNEVNYIGKSGEEGEIKSIGEERELRRNLIRNVENEDRVGGDEVEKMIESKELRKGEGINDGFEDDEDVNKVENRRKEGNGILERIKVVLMKESENEIEENERIDEDIEDLKKVDKLGNEREEIEEKGSLRSEREMRIKM